uniref:Sm ribonucleo n=1 Tax=Thermofilum pendens TaxID=2269 RepID=A0A7C1SMD4_THEPE
MAPLDYIRRANGKSVLVKLKDGSEYIGRLKFLDYSMNIILEEAKEVSETSKVLANIGTVFIRGSNLLYVSLDLSKVTFFEQQEAAPAQQSGEEQEAE